MNILLTGYTGNLGPALAQQLSEHQLHAVVRDPAAIATPMPAHVTLHVGSLEHLPQHLAADTEIILHSAASTAFRAPLGEIRQPNVQGVSRILEYAQHCPRLRKVVHLSTACVCGDMTGTIPEAPLPRPANFINAYEQSKWEAETLLQSQSDVPYEIVRLSIVAGSERDGSVPRLGALHHTLFWLWKGLIPMMPGTAESRVDLISLEYAAAVVAACVEAPVQQGRILHGCAADHAPSLPALLDELTIIFSQQSPAWRSGSILPPAVVDAETFALFEASVKLSRDVLFLRVVEDAQSFLPGLLHPRRHDTTLADALCPHPRPDWKHLTQLVTQYVLTTRS